MDSGDQGGQRNGTGSQYRDRGRSQELEELVDSFSRTRERLELAVDEWNEMQATLESKVDERTQQLQTAQRKLLQADRLASLGQRADW
jgi:C4-dicarboxylate-specific signal transduction histidine kinase